MQLKPEKCKKEVGRLYRLDVDVFSMQIYKKDGILQKNAIIYKKGLLIGEERGFYVNIDRVSAIFLPGGGSAEIVLREL
jgi:hypothetical protein